MIKIKNIVKSVSLFGLIGTIFLLVKSSNAKAYNVPTLNSNEQVRFSSLFNEIKNEMSNDNDSYYNIINIASQEFEDWQYSSLFSNDGYLNTNNSFLYDSSTYLYHTSGISNTQNFDYVFNDYSDIYYLVFYSEYSNTINFNYAYVDANNYIDMYIPNDTISFNGDANEYNNYIKLTSGYNVYSLSFNSIFSDFCYQYGYSWRDTNGYGVYIDDMLKLYLNTSFTFDNSTKFTYAIYSKRLLNYILLDYNYEISQSYNNGYSSGNTNGYNTGYANGQIAGQQEGYSLGQQDGYSSGYTNGRAVGYNEGQASVSNANATIMGLFGSIANVPITILNGLFPVELLNVPIITIILTLLSVVLLIWLIKKLL